MWGDFFFNKLRRQTICNSSGYFKFVAVYTILKNTFANIWQVQFFKD